MFMYSGNIVPDLFEIEKCLLDNGLVFQKGSNFYYFSEYLDEDRFAMVLKDEKPTLFENESAIIRALGQHSGSPIYSISVKNFQILAEEVG
jgi:hypothetical protein